MKNFWRRLREKPNFKNKSILDFGCGHGALCLDIAKITSEESARYRFRRKFIEFC